MADSNEVLPEPTATALMAALNRREGTQPWTIGLPPGDYGNLNLDDCKLPGNTVLRSTDFPRTGAKVRAITMQRAENIEFHFINLDRNGTGYMAYPCNLDGARRCGIWYSDLDFGPNVRNAEPRGYLANCTWGVRIWRDDKTKTRAQDITLCMNYIHGAADCAVYVSAADRITIADNVYADISGDDNQFGAADGIDFINNWGSRRKYPTWNEKDGWKHTDFAQMNTWQKGTRNGAFLRNINFIGNVVLKGDWDPSIGIPAQGLFASKTNTENVLYEDNIISANTPNAIYNDNKKGAIARGNRIRFNTALRVVDDFTFKSHEARVAVAGSVEVEKNVMCALPRAALGDGLVINMKGGDAPDYSASRAYYISPTKTASFYDHRPVERQVTHWDYEDAGARQGAFKQFYDVIVDHKYPQLGPAAAAWIEQYDPDHQIA